MLKVQWGPASELQVDSVEQLDVLLDQLDSEHHADEAILVVVESDDSGNTLTIGVGRNLSVLSFVPGSGDPPYYSSVGDEESEELVTFRYMGESTEFPLRKCIPRELAREAVRHFAATGERSDQVSWEED